MNNLSTSKHSRMPNRWLSMPWGTFLFILTVFVFATPVRIFRFGLSMGSIEATDAISMTTDLLGRDNLERQMALILLGAFALISLVRRRTWLRFQNNGMLGWFILFYLIWAVLSIMWSIDTRFTLKRVAILVLLSLGALSVADRFSLRQTIALVFFINAIFLLSSIIIVFSNNYFHPFTSTWRFTGNVHPIVQGWQCGLLILASLALSKTTENKRAVYYGIALIAFLFLWLTRSRGPIVGLMLGSAVYVGLTASMRYKVALFLGIVIFGCLLVFLPENVLNTLGESVITAGRGGEGLESMETLSNRLPLWKACLSAANESPLLGYGYNSFFAPQNIEPFARKVGWTAATPHSGYIGAALGLGYPGAFALVLFLFLSIKMSVRLALRDSNYAFVAAVLVWLCVCLYSEEDLLTRPSFQCFTWMILLAKLGFYRKTEQEIHDGRPSD